MWFVYDEREKSAMAKKIKVEDKSKVEDKKLRLTSETFDEKYYS